MSHGFHIPFGDALAGRTYGELLEYLQQLDPRIQRAELDFEGKSRGLEASPFPLIVGGFSFSISMSFFIRLGIQFFDFHVFLHPPGDSVFRFPCLSSSA